MKENSFQFLDNNQTQIIINTIVILPDYWAAINCYKNYKQL